MTTKRDMKAFVRYDGSGKIVPSSVILARKIPKVGKWVEIDAYTCCQPSIPVPSIICVDGFIGNDGFNGTYSYVNDILSRPHYQKDDGLYDIYWDGQKWNIGEVARSVENVHNPVLVTEWEHLPTDGTITVESGSCTTTTTTIPG